VISHVILRASRLVCFIALVLPAFSQSVTVSPTSISFGNQAQGTTSSVHKVTLKNGQSSAITISSISTNLSDFGETNNCPVSPATLKAGASCTISVTFTPSVQGTRSGTLTVVDTGLSSPQLVTLTGTGTAAILESIAVTPSTASVIVANTQQFTATGTYSDGSSQNITTSVSWVSSSTSTATIGLHTGLAKGVAAGTATLTASMGTVKNTASLTVTAAVLTSIAVTPATASVAAGKTQQFTATGTYNNGTTQNLTSSAAWTSSATSVATVSSGGLATSLAQGTATITATSGTISGSATLTVTGAVLSSIAVTPNSASVAAGATQQFTATGTYSDGTTKNLTTTANWTSSSTAVATIGAHTGLATGIAAGTATITANSGKISGSATLTVTPVLTSISVAPNPASIASGATQQFTATGTYSDGSTQNLTSTANWSSSQTSVATIASGGLATGVGVGTATITASSGSITGSATLTVGQPVLVSIAVTPANPSFALGATFSLTATGTYSDGSTANLTTTANWSSANSSIATVNSQGVAGSVAVGSTSITATSGTISGSTTVTVTAAALVSIAVTPAIPTLPQGASQQFTATGTYTDGSMQNITSTATWSSGTPGVATISNASPTVGLATAVAQGTATITATSGSVSGSTTLTVTAAALVSISITPTTPSIAVGTTQQFTATGNYTDGSMQDLTSTAAWSSDTPGTATINNTGLATGVAQGTATITAASGSVSNSTVLTVTAAALVSIAINPPTAAVPFGTTQQFTATGTYTDGSMQDLTQTGHWSSTAATVATISNATGTAGLATSVGTGTTTIGISSGSVSGSATLVVNPAALVSIAISPQSPTIALGTTQQFTATGTYTDGSTQDLTSVATWSSSDATIATISNSMGSYGLATSSGQGTATISATSNSISASTTLTVTVTGRTLVSIAITPTSATIALGNTQQFVATGTYSDNSTQTITTSVTWSSSNTSVATISNSAGSQGLASTVTSGTVSVTAALGSVTSPQATLTVSPTLVSISLSPQSPLIALGSNQQFTATGTYSDGSTQNITDFVTWTSGTQTVATISNSAGSQGLATSVAVGTSTITATLGSPSSSTELSVAPLWPAQSWTLHGPPGRSSHSVVWDPNSRQMIIFGGKEAITNTNLNDVWLGTTSTALNEGFTAESSSGTAPQGRYGHVGTYDSHNNRMMIFGGSVGASSSCDNDVWILSGANGQSGTPSWISVTPSGTAPTSRLYSGGAYDSNTNSMIVFGGSNCSGQYFNDVWVLSNANGLAGTSAWTQLTPSGTAPRARESGTTVYDSANNILIVYGGDAGGSPFGDVWVLTNANGTGGTPSWAQLAPNGTAPSARTGHTAIFDSVNDRMTIFAGTNNSGFTFSDAWVLTSANGIGSTPGWTQIPAQGTAPSLAYHGAVYDAASDNMYVFAGISSQNKLQANNHAFTLNGANGISSTGEKWFLGGPPVRYSHSAFYDSSTNGLFIFAGQHASSNINFGDYWEESQAIGSSNLQWTLISSNGSKPSDRFGHTGLYDSGSNRMMVFGGATGFPAPCVNDYHVLKQANNQGGIPTWVSVTPTGNPPGIRARHASVYDSGTNTIIIFGGYNCTGSYYSDVWILQNANDVSGQPTWIHLQPTGSAPTARESSSAIYDPTTNSLVVYGGDAGGASMGEIWVLSNANGTGGNPVWTQLNPSNNGPVPRSGHTATYDSTSNVMTIYGGFDGTNVLGDAWVLSGANGQAGSATWTQLIAGQVRRFHTSNYDPTSNQIITYGGATGTVPQDPVSDVYTLTDANDVP
jgi:uncharacterized protein YjdB